MSDIIKIDHLCKRFGSVEAVRDLSFRVKRGELFAFLGINGAGKSTTISILCGQLAKDGGRVQVGGADVDTNPDQIKRILGVVFQKSVLDGALSVKDNLKYRAALYGIRGEAFQERLTQLAQLLGFSDLLNRTVGKLSGGQRRRIDIARALLHAPEILILDEPTTGLDPQTRTRLWEVLEHLRQEQHMTIFLTTHYMEEAAQANYVVILDSGRIVAEGTPLALKNTYAEDYIMLYQVTEEQVRTLGVPYTPWKKDSYRIAVSSPAEATTLIAAHPALFVDYEVYKGKMDDVFLAATQKA